jgi:hypothetical protein
LGAAEKKARVAPLRNRIREACKAAGTTERRLCTDLGLSLDTFRLIERRGAVYASTLMQVAKRLRIPLTHFADVATNVIVDMSLAEWNAALATSSDTALTTASGGAAELAEPSSAYMPAQIMVAPIPRHETADSREGREWSPAPYPAELIGGKLRGAAEDFWWDEVDGAAMLPDLRDGDRILVDRRDVLPRHPAIFAIDQGLGPTVRWVEHVPGSAPTLYRISCSDDRFGSYDIPVDRVRILGKVVWVSRCL